MGSSQSVQQVAPPEPVLPVVEYHVPTLLYALGIFALVCVVIFSIWPCCRCFRRGWRTIQQLTDSVGGQTAPRRDVQPSESLLLPSLGSPATTTTSLPSLAPMPPARPASAPPMSCGGQPCLAPFHAHAHACYNPNPQPWPLPTVVTGQSLPTSNSGSLPNPQPPPNHQVNDAV